MMRKLKFLFIAIVLLCSCEKEPEEKPWNTSVKVLGENGEILSGFKFEIKSGGLFNVNKKTDATGYVNGSEHKLMVNYESNRYYNIYCCDQQNRPGKFRHGGYSREINRGQSGLSKTIVEFYFY